MKTSMLKEIFAVCLFMAAGAALAQGSWKPEKTVELVVGVAAGGAVDKSAREMQRIFKGLGIENTVVVNKPGGGNTLSWVYLNQHAGDGHYVLVQAPNLLTNKIHGVTQLTYSDFSPLCLLLEEYMAVSVRADSPIKTGRELIEQLKKDPSALSIAVASALGNHIHTAIAKPLKTSGIELKKLKVVAFKSSGDSVIALLGGHIDVVSSSTPNAVAQLRNGKTRILAVTAPRRFGGDLAGVPTWAEQGVDGTFSSWRGLLGPKGLNARQIAYWEGMCAKLTDNDTWKKSLAHEFWAPRYLGSAEVTKYWASQYKEYRDILGEIGLAKD
ncbi:MAG: tripartite tricarboxylate transporter substrate binding protein [Betaproteobacteria bacterium]|nr:tripartite tricarboxylate transporter substrate binding protein [Betaproteobacteria bacterium]